MDAAAKDVGERARAACSPSTAVEVNKMATRHGGCRVACLLAQEGRKFEVVTDHKPLLGLLGPDKAVPAQASPRVVRWTVRLAAYRYRMVYRPGKDLAPADALRRLPLPEVPAAIPEPAEVFMLEHSYPEVVPRVEELAERTYSHKAAELNLQQDCVLWGSWVVIPQSLWSRILQLLHAGHPGMEKTRKVARSHVPPYHPASNGATERVVQTVKVKLKKSKAGDFWAQVARVLF
ncbi:uncharacterized protein LOC144180119 [Haemaphysalis longicornis]